MPTTMRGTITTGDLDRVNAATVEPVEIEFDPAPELEEVMAFSDFEEVEAEEAPPPKPKKRAQTATKPPSEQAIKQAKKRKTGPTRTRTVEVEEDLFDRKEIVSVRLGLGETPYAIWNCADAPGEAIRVNSGTVLRFRNGLLECRNEADDAAVAVANEYAGGKYIRAEEKYLDDPFVYIEDNGRQTSWYSKKAYERYVALHPRRS